METLLAVVGSLIFVVLLLILWQVSAIKKKLGAKAPGDGGATPPLPTFKSHEDDSPNNPKQDPPLPT